MSKESSLLYVITAPSGTGKTSLVRELVKHTERLIISVSYTTRPKRSLEEDGVDYHFISDADFQKRIKAGKFLEYAEVYDYYYGTSKDWVNDQLAKGLDVILEIDWQGALQVKQHFENCVTVFILPPSFKELRRRLVHREQDSLEVIETRLQKAVNEIQYHREFDFIIINEKFEEALADLQAIVRCQRLRQTYQKVRHEQLLTELMASSR